MDHSWVEDALHTLKEQDLYRTLQPLKQLGAHVTMNDRSYLNFSSNDYLSLSQDPEMCHASIEATKRWGTSATASRFLAGSSTIHHALEKEIAAWKEAESARIFGSGYLANLGILSTLASSDDHLFMDRLCHASLIDGARLSSAQIHRFHHNDMKHLETLLQRYTKGKKLIITESVFSMDGDCAPLQELYALSKKYHSYLLIDDAHAMGIFGKNGNGLATGKEHILVVNTFGKALGSYGGAVICSELLSDLITQRARTLIYTTGLPPSVIETTRQAIKLIQQHTDWGTTLLSKAALFQELLYKAHIPLTSRNSHITSLLCESSTRAIHLAQALFNEGILAFPIRPPTVPEKQARIRFSCTLGHSQEELQQTAEKIIYFFQKL